ncbi:hypothetical protein FOPG_16753 [Fusarium oxysporum f. sp. conglutinans race 2 54008]|uniref:Uncharacterized protein n=2 Tax=Fusarium oxysporum f. sp. conglutinans TaxID=100902 RepID=F9GAF5_FUSOF|nr:hypothetical protein FOXB_15637 [Fusarium oxysporum f. sp. conglutinans Fo5176]EXL67111.1 hypothetical protein FOPG_16753 [Fusarium oxysporum f. sp. conglutinans race 2 54008]KAG6981992.1 hypothetical protein FocnCong_v009300 [Fusarium oxysporum f. sp. conglutinans]KAI8414198.1 hypothetical protein FOFC_03808 [Fusarium oxysporum]
MSEMAKVNFIAQPNIMQLEDTIMFFVQQKVILDSLFAALGLLLQSPDRHKKYRRIRPMVKFVYQANHDNDESKRRQKLLATLDHYSKSLCFFALKPSKILELKNETFDAMMDGLPKFIAAESQRHILIKERIGDYVQDIVAEFDQTTVLVIDQTSSFSTITRKEDQPRKRQKMSLERRRNTGKPELPKVSSLMPIPSTTASVPVEALPAQQDQEHIERANCTESNSQSRNLSSSSWQSANMGYCYDNDSLDDDGSCQPDWLTRGLTLDISMMEMGNTFPQPLDLLPLSETSWLSRDLCL